MRHHVPFVGERKVVRANDESARAKRTSGRVIDDVVGEGPQESSWDDVVPEGWLDKTKPVPAKTAAHVAVPRAHVPLRAGSGKTAPAKKKLASSVNSITFSDSPSLDWVSINSGRGLRVSIHGNIDNNLRKEWSRLLEETEGTDIKEFEFNLNETPALSLTGLGMLLLFKERKGSARDAIKLCNCNKDVAQILEWTGMDKYFSIQNTQISEMS
ncbi:STAS domain-containing protein [Cellvibrio sp. UBA7661]|uniref:STAS domain-containing protein n=1 Tax=Cellvibrio sp. UBA7661 TaxID=1946311 RepID=UPI002F34FE99